MSEDGPLFLFPLSRGQTRVTSYMTEFSSDRDGRLEEILEDARTLFRRLYAALAGTVAVLETVRDPGVDRPDAKRLEAEIGIFNKQLQLVLSLEAQLGKHSRTGGTILDTGDARREIAERLVKLRERS